VLLGIIILAFWYFRDGIVNESVIKASIKDVYELTNPGTSVTGITLIKEGSVYRVIFKLNGGLQEVYVDKDGKYVFPTWAEMSSTTSSFEAQKNFYTCLSDNQVILYGQIGTNVTTAQLNALGSSPYLNYIYFDCSGDNLQTCISRNVTLVPTWEIDGILYSGSFTPADLQSLTGCST